jgi:hypothetical protein
MDRLQQVHHDVTGHNVKIHKVTPVVVNERGDVEIKDYVGFSWVQTDMFCGKFIVGNSFTHENKIRDTCTRLSEEQKVGCKEKSKFDPKVEDNFRVFVEILYEPFNDLQKRDHVLSLSEHGCD